MKELPLHVSLGIEFSGGDKSKQSALIAAAQSRVRAGMDEAQVRSELTELSKMTSDELKRLARDGTGTKTTLIDYFDMVVKKARKKPTEEELLAGKIVRLEGGNYDHLGYSAILRSHNGFLKQLLASKTSKDRELLRERCIYWAADNSRDACLSTLCKAGPISLRVLANAALLVCGKGDGKSMEVILDRAGAANVPAICNSIIGSIAHTEIAQEFCSKDPALKAALTKHFKSEKDWDILPSGLGGVERDKVDEKELKLLSHNIVMEGYSQDIANKYAHTFLRLFDTAAKAMKYVDTWSTREKQPVHDAISLVSLPKTLKNKDAWAVCLMKYGKPAMQLVDYCDRIEPSDLKTMQESIATLTFGKGHMHSELARFCVKYNIGEDSFNAALKLIDDLKEFAPDEDKIPEVDVEYDGLRMTKLPRGDIRGLFLGKIVNCCQSIGGVAESCTIAGFSNPKSGFYIVQDKQGAIIGESWAWEGKDKTLVFDSLEALGGRIPGQKWDNLLRKASDSIAAAGYEAINVGTGGNTPGLTSVPGKSSNAAFNFKFSGYTDDSSTQTTVWRKGVELAPLASPLKSDVGVSTDAKPMLSKLQAKALLENYMLECHDNTLLDLVVDQKLEQSGLDRMEEEVIQSKTVKLQAAPESANEEPPKKPAKAKAKESIVIPKVEVDEAPDLIEETPDDLDM